MDLGAQRPLEPQYLEEACAHDLRCPVSGLRESEKEAYQLIQECLGQENMSLFDKLNFLSAVETLSGAVHVQADSNINNYFPKNILARKIESLILEEPIETLDNFVRQKAMLCTVALSQLNPSFYLSQKLDLANACISRVFPLPLIMPSLDRKESASLYLQTVQALDDMMQALVMDNMKPDMLILQNFLEIILPWVTLSDKVHEQTRALGTISRLQRFICNFPEVLHMTLFSMSGKLMGTLGLMCVNSNQEISMEASEALHYLFKTLALQRGVKQKIEIVLRDLQKNFRGEWMTSLQDLTLFFRKYLTPMERADVIMVALEAMISTNRQDILAASKVLKMILKYSIPEIGKVSEIIEYIYFHMYHITESTTQSTIRRILYLLVQSYTDEVILTLFKIMDESQKEIHHPWEILASFPKGYEMIMEYLLQRLIPLQAKNNQEPSNPSRISPLIATRAIYELLQEPSRRMELHGFFSSLFVRLLFQVSLLVLEGSAEMIHGQQPVIECVDPVSSTVEALKTLMCSSGYEEHMEYVNIFGGWNLLVSPEKHYDGVTLLARALVIKNCWHNRPIFSFIIRILQDTNCPNHVTALVFLTELLQSPDVAAIVDDIATHILANWFKCEELTTVKLLLQVTEVFAKHKNLVRRLSILQPHVLRCCYSPCHCIVEETFLTLNHLLEDLTWQHSSFFLIQLAFTLGSFLEEEPENLRLMAFQVYGNLLSKIKKRDLVFPLKQQMLNSIVLLVLHLKDVNTDVAQICQLSLCHTATLLGWTKLKTVFTQRDVFTILRILLQLEASKAIWFLNQCVTLFKSPQVFIRQAAVWFAGQIIQTLNLEEMDEVEDANTALRHMQKDPDPVVSCLTTQTLYILEAQKKVLQAKTTTSCFCRRRPRRRSFEPVSLTRFLKL
ncbi:maestro heat-like repeat-containing protein family member 7 [Marmota monax]|uniref:maestro heat-like repeat-containing protein family member 7 n=1 Tax=Marmota monax TaxID=9995 RepID=UPI001EAFDDF7|nr:maestro heat-like repeat-containing protein family member 7 [Marmota monax]